MPVNYNSMHQHTIPYAQALHALYNVQREISQRQLAQPIARQQQIPNRLSNAQYFVHELYFYLGFDPIEIAAHTDIQLHTVLDLMTETLDTLPQATFQRLAYFYCTAARQTILPQCRVP